jgi:CcmD family protein
MHIQNFGSLFAAYIAVWAIFFIYDFTVARRMSRVEKDLAELKRQMPRG